ncbi:MAG: hypothetical protein M3P51_14710 [Chloroflexota bacterium]|nr:hypothetical protein [Chloroflexota bacterium]
MRPAISFPTLALLLVLLVCIIVGLLARTGAESPLTLPGGSETPARAVRRTVCGPDTLLAEFEVYETYWSEEEFGPHALVVYRAECRSRPGDPPQNEFAGYESLDRSWFSWRLQGGGSYDDFRRYVEDRPSSPPTELLEYSAGTGGDEATGQFAFSVVRVLAPEEVAVVEATFDNGRTVRRRVAGGVTATILLAPGADHVCEVRALGPTGRVLRSYDAAANDGDPTVDARRACVSVRR